MTKKEEQYGEIVKLFSLALNQYRLYSENHPTVQMAVRNLFSVFKGALKSDGVVNLLSAGDHLSVNNVSLDKKTTGVASLLNEWGRRQIEVVTFEPGLGDGEIESFLKLLALPVRSREEVGGFKKKFAEARFRHIRLGSARFQVVREEEKVIGREEIGPGLGKGEESGGKEGLGEGGGLGKGRGLGGKEGPGGKEGFGVGGGLGGLGEGEGSLELEEEIDVGAIPGRLPRIGRMEEAIERFLKGGGGEIAFDAQRLAGELETNPREVALQMVRRAQSPEELRGIVKRMGEFLQERLAQSFLLQGMDFSQPISRLATEFMGIMEGPEARGDFKPLSGELVEILERSADGVRVELIARAFRETGADPERLLEMIAKFLPGKEVRGRILEALKKRLGGLGVGAEEITRLFAAQELGELRERVTVLEREKVRVLAEKVRIDAIIRNMGEGLVVVDNEGKIQLMNPAAEKLLGIEPEKGRGSPIVGLLKAEHLLAVAKGPLRDQVDRITKEIEVKSVSDDTRRILQASSAVIENEEGNTVGMVSVLSDITRQKEIEEMKSAFVAHVSHELRTPLFAIEQSLALLIEKESGESNPEREQFLSIAHRNIVRLSRLVNDLLDMAKLEAGQMRLNKISFKICDLVHHGVETLRGWMGSMELTMAERYPENDIEVEADPDRLTQVVTNLVGNAIKFTPSGGKITVEVDPHYIAPEISEEPCIVISVQDTGVGIAEKDQKRIFEKFEQASVARRQGVSSSGLGLTIAKEIVELHGGKIWVESKPGEGSRFVFVFPRRSNGGVGR